MPLRFYVKSILLNFQPEECTNLLKSKFRPMKKEAIFEVLNSVKSISRKILSVKKLQQKCHNFEPVNLSKRGLISRKIWVAGKWPNFHIVSRNSELKIFGQNMTKIGSTIWRRVILMVSHFTASFSSFQRRKPFGTWHKILSWDETSIKLSMTMGVCVKRVKIWPLLPALWQTGNGPITQAEKNSVFPTQNCQK